MKCVIFSVKRLFVLFLVCMAISVSGCARVMGPPPPLTSQGPLTREEKPARGLESPSPRALASLRLTEQGRLLLEAGKPDEAIRVVERAISLHPTSGQNYYYLAEAWLLKGNRTQAQECNRLASLYLDQEPEWSARVMAQRYRIGKRGR